MKGGKGVYKEWGVDEKKNSHEEYGCIACCSISSETLLVNAHGSPLALIFMQIRMALKELELDF